MKSILKLFKSKSFYLCLAMALLAVFIARLPDAEDLSSVEVVEELISVPAARGSLDQILAIPGVIAETEAQPVTLASQVEIQRWLVSNGDYVKEGDPLALVEPSSVRDAIETVNAAMKTLDSHLEITGLDSVGDKMRSGVSGRVKAIYAAPGDTVQDVMSEYGCLMLLSLDGQLAAELEAEGLTMGETVTVELPDGSSSSGTVSSIEGSTVRITIPDHAAALGDPITVRCGEQILGHSTLFVNRPLKICGYWGTVAYVNVQPEQEIQKNHILLGLEDIAYTGRRDRLLSQREDLEKQLSALYAAVSTGTLSAPVSGRVSGIEKETLNILVPTPASMSHSSSPAGGIQLLGRSPQVGGVRLLSAGASEADGGEENESGEGKPGEGKPGESKPDWNIDELREMLKQYLDEETLQRLEQLLDSDILKNPDLDLLFGMMFRQPVMIGGPVTPSFIEKDSYLVEENTFCFITPYEEAQIELAVDQRDIFHFALDQELQITLDALPGEVFTAKVNGINTVGSGKEGSTKYKVTLLMPRTETMLSGMSCTAAFSLGRAESLLLIPCAALQEDENGAFVYTAYDPHKDLLGAPVHIQTGLSDGCSAQVLEGLTDGQTVYYRYATAMRYRFLNNISQVDTTRP